MSIFDNKNKELSRDDIINILAEKNKKFNVPLNANIDDRKRALYEFLDTIIDEFIIKKPTFINAVEREIIPKDKMREEIYKFIDIKANNMTKEDKEFLLKSFETYIWGYGPIQELIDDDDITDIRTVDFDNVRIKKFNKRLKSKISFSNRDSMKQFINFVAIKNKVTLSDINAIQRITDKNTSDKFILRINICSEYINSVEYPYLYIRKIRKNKYSLDELQNLNMFNEDIKNYLINAIKSGLSIVVAGKGAVGKTTIINALIDEIDDNKSCLIIQEAEELHSNHPESWFQRVRYSTGESKISYTLRDESINGLLIDLDYFIIGEIKGEEAWDFVNAAYTGHSVLTSLHSSSSEEALDKLVHYVRYSKFATDLKETEITKMFSHLDILLFMDNFKAIDIREISGFNSETGKVDFNQVFKFDIKKVDGNITGDFVKVKDSCSKIKEKMLYRQYFNTH